MRSLTRPSLLAMLLLGTTPILTSCGALNRPILITVTMPPSRACEVWKPVYYSAKHDSEDTVKQARENNSGRDSVCGVAAPPATSPPAGTPTAPPGPVPGVPAGGPGALP